MLGGAVGELAAALLHDSVLQPGAFALVGMGAVFAGIVRAPVTSIVIIFEMTHNYSIILPLMAANITSYALARRLSPVPIYDALLAQDGIHLPSPGRDAFRKLRVGAAMNRRVATLSAESTVGDAASRIALLPAYGEYPLLDGAGRFAGMVKAADLRRAREAGQDDRRLGDVAMALGAVAHPDQGLDAVLVALGRDDVGVLPVVSRQDPGRLLGMVGARDVARALARAAAAETEPRPARSTPGPPPGREGALVPRTDGGGEPGR
jgi:CIC family chloride channel protein